MAAQVNMSFAMTDFILHQYAPSPFSEKIRLLMGYKQQAYKAVDIPMIMPKPDLMPLTGGYRKTPVAQIGADIYCDSAIICKLIDRLYPENSIYDEELEATLGAMAHWTDTFFFKVSVAMAFQPRALQNNPLFNDPQAAAAFQKDRAELSQGSTELGMDFPIAEAHWHLHLRRLDQQLKRRSFLMSEQPTIVDFSTYHCLWFVNNNEALQDLFVHYEHVSQWMQRMQAFGQGDMTEISGEAALKIAAQAKVQTGPKQGVELLQGLKPGDAVTVMPIDYGFQPTTGTLLVNSLEEIVVKREDPKVGEVAVHFPRMGFQVNPA